MRLVDSWVSDTGRERYKCSSAMERRSYSFVQITEQRFSRTLNRCKVFAPPHPYEQSHKLPNDGPARCERVEAADRQEHTTFAFRALETFRNISHQRFADRGSETHYPWFITVSAADRDRLRLLPSMRVVGLLLIPV